MPPYLRMSSWLSRITPNSLSSFDASLTSSIWSSGLPFFFFPPLRLLRDERRERELRTEDSLLELTEERLAPSVMVSLALVKSIETALLRDEDPIDFKA